jgi:hypothetical protein
METKTHMVCFLVYIHFVGLSGSEFEEDVTHARPDHLQKKSLKAVTLLNYFQEYPGSNPIRGTDYSEIIRGFPKFIRDNSWIAPLKFGNDLFLSHNSQLIIHYSCYQSTSYTWTSKSVVK